MSEAPPFWFQSPGLAAWALAPFGWVYSAVASKRMGSKPSYVSSLPVFCVGNLLAGGAGKTPTALAVAAIAKAMGHTPGFLSRGYGGSVSKPTLVDLAVHNARDIGDEPLLLAQACPTVVSSDRPAGARLLETMGVDLIIMDDGFQNPSLYKDFSLVVVDARRGLGNAFTIPAGPMRASLRAQLPHASAILVIGASDKTALVVRQAARMAKPTLAAALKARHASVWKGVRALAFAGIADPEKFFETARALGVDVVEQKSFPDHGVYSTDDCNQLLQAADRGDLTLITTTKDAARLKGMGSAQDLLLKHSHIVQVEMQFETPKMVEGLIADTFRKARAHRLALKG
ncbi:MAG: tetraacyldisaccharide 4'-kinase [Pseudomonadota bacterium]